MEYERLSLADRKQMVENALKGLESQHFTAQMDAEANRANGLEEQATGKELDAQRFASAIAALKVRYGKLLRYKPEPARPEDRDGDRPQLVKGKEK